MSNNIAGIIMGSLILVYLVVMLIACAKIMQKLAGEANKSLSKLFNSSYFHLLWMDSFILILLAVLSYIKWWLNLIFVVIVFLIRYGIL